MKLYHTLEEIPYESPFEYYREHSGSNSGISLLFESCSKNTAYGRQSIVVPSAALRITGKNASYSINARTEAGEAFIHGLTSEDVPYATEISRGSDFFSGNVRQKEDC